MPSFFPFLPSQSEAHFVAELQGLEGAFSFSELILQKVWLRQDFAAPAAGTEEGHRLEIVYPGRWNRQAGPDFLGAKIRLDGRTVVGDVELHLYVEDWDAHKHIEDPRYDSVILHVVLFPPSRKPATHGAKGVIPTLTLLPLMRHDMESLAEDDALERLAGFPARRLLDAFREHTPERMREILQEHARGRWNDKVRFAAGRVKRFGLEGAAHQLALECLGTTGNRLTMYEIALGWPFPEWVEGRADADYLGDLFSSSWNLRGSRPENYPRKRLRQYAEWVRAVPDWPTRLLSLAQSLPRDGDPRLVLGNRRGRCFVHWSSLLHEELVAKVLRAGKFDAFVCDVVLPLLTASAGASFHDLWFAWKEGCLPASIRSALRDARCLDPAFKVPCNGFAQGLLGWSQTSDLKEAL